MAFEHLRAEGYIEGRKGTGTFVSLALPDDSLSASRPAIHLNRQVRVRVSRKEAAWRRNKW